MVDEIFPRRGHLTIAGIISSLSIIGLATASIACSASPTQQPRAETTEVATQACTRESAAVRPFLRANHEAKKQGLVEDLDRQLRGPTADVLFFGDSIVQRWPASELQRAFPGQRVLNMGIGGERVADMLYRLRAAAPGGDSGSSDPGLTSYESQNPNTIVVLIGTNDLRGKSTCYISQGTAEIADAFRAIYPRARLIFFGILPRVTPDRQFGVATAEVNRAVARMGMQSKRFETADISKTYTCPARKSCDIALLPNFLHPSPSGYTLLSNGVREYFLQPR